MPIINTIQQKGLGFVRRREKAKIIRCKRYCPFVTKERHDYYRVLIFLYYPWRDLGLMDVSEDNIHSSDNIYRIFTLYKDIIEQNRRLFESVDTTIFDKAVDAFEVQLDQHNQDEVAIEAQNLSEAQKRLQNFTNNFTDNLQSSENQENSEEFDNEEFYVEQIERMYGFQNEMIEFQRIPTRKTQQQGELRFQEKMEKQQFREMITSLNRGQQIVLINYIKMIKSGETFQLFIKGPGGK